MEMDFPTLIASYYFLSSSTRAFKLDLHLSTFRQNLEADANSSSQLCDIEVNEARI